MAYAGTSAGAGRSSAHAASLLTPLPSSAAHAARTGQPQASLATGHPSPHTLAPLVLPSHPLAALSLSPHQHQHQHHTRQHSPQASFAHLAHTASGTTPRAASGNAASAASSPTAEQQQQQSAAALHHTAALSLQQAVALRLSPPLPLATFRGHVAPGALVAAEFLIPYALLATDPNGTGCVRLRLECAARRPQQDASRTWKRLPVTLRARWPRTESGTPEDRDERVVNPRGERASASTPTLGGDELYASRTRDICVPHADGDWLRVAAGLMRLPKTDRDRGRGFIVPARGNITFFLFQLKEKGRSKDRVKRRSSTGSVDGVGPGVTLGGGRGGSGSGSLRTSRGKSSKLGSIASDDGIGNSSAGAAAAGGDSEDMVDDAFEPPLFDYDFYDPQGPPPRGALDGCVEPLPSDYHLIATFTLQASVKNAGPDIQHAQILTSPQTQPNGSETLGHAWAALVAPPPAAKPPPASKPSSHRRHASAPDRTAVADAAPNQAAEGARAARALQVPPPVHALHSISAHDAATQPEQFLLDALRGATQVDNTKLFLSPAGLAALSAKPANMALSFAIVLVGNLSATGVLAAVGDAPHVHVDVHGGSATIAAERLPVTRAHSLLSRIAALVDVEARIIRPLKSVRPVLKPSAIVTGNTGASLDLIFAVRGGAGVEHSTLLSIIAQSISTACNDDANRMPLARRPDAISLVGYDALFCVYAVRLHLLQSRMSAVHDWLRQLEQLCASLAKGESNMHDLQVVPLLYSLGYAVSHGEALDIMAAEMLVELGTKN